MNLISHPFRLSNGGRVAVAPQESDDADANLIAVLVLTVRGERPLVPTFGISDPAFSSLAAADVSAGVDLFGPDVTIEHVESGVTRDGVQQVEVAYG